MSYQYVAYNEKGQTVRGKIQAASEEAATELLGYAGYRTVSLKPYVPFFNLDKLKQSMSQVTPSEVILIYRQLALLLESGTDMATSLDLLREQSTNNALKKVLGEVASEVRGGSQLSTALGRHPKIFSPIYCQLLRVGEHSGNLEVVLKQVADYMEKEIGTSKEVKRALTMPAITLVVAVVVIVLLLIFILPSFSKLYATLGADLPPMTKMLLAFGEKGQAYGVYFFIAMFVILGAVIVYIKTPRGRYKWDKLLLTMPLLGRVRHLSELARFCRTMSLLFRAGLPSTEVMPLTIETTSNRALAKALADVHEGMLRGQGLYQPMTRDKLFLPMLIQMVKVGEETGNLDATLMSAARSYEAEVEDKMRSLIGLIQPAMTLVLGGVVAFIAISLVSAMTSMYGKAF